ncbi:hypothetical protein E8D34_17015 [Nocardioides sp. GY 10113]|uniref:hypothetical protein n=1 Tax=Nocardioides sp. GY 10113 TaxID=2569761 RepID=UPI0010A864E2|nr:hypothetical protein [Nocardioides sp. GY 10113]TIC82185.1 hypothetical protein E8D34_17015 [Nocardioides sp. GY 10113]
MTRSPRRRRLASAASTALLTLGLTAGLAGVAPASQADDARPWGARTATVERLATTGALRAELRANLAYRSARDSRDVLHLLSEAVPTLRAVRTDVLAGRSPRLRTYVGATPITDDHFTLTVLGDQACVREKDGGAAIAVTAGPCAGDAVATSATPVQDLLGFVDAASRPMSAAVFWRYLRQVMLPTYLGAAHSSIHFAPRSLTDRNGDSMDDDLRFQFTRGGRTQCLEAPLARGDELRVRPVPCRELPRRNSAWLSRAAGLDEGATEVVESLRNVSRRMDRRISRLSGYDVGAVRRTMSTDYRLTRPRPLTFRLWERTGRCWVTISFTADRVGADAMTSPTRCRE